MPKHIVVTGAFDDLRSGHVRFLEEAAKLGELTVLLWPDEAIQKLTAQAPKFPQAERLYFLSAVRYVRHAHLVEGPLQPDELPQVPGLRPDVWVVGDCRANPAKAAHARARGVEYHVLGGEKQLKGFPDPTAPGRAFHRVPDLLRRDGDGVESVPAKAKKKVVVTGCYDWFHSGHVRFFEEVSAYGDLYVIVGHDANIRLLKGEGRPLFPQEERRYVVGSIRFVTQALISSGHGWLDADPEIQRIKPDLYAVNEDGDQGGKSEYCAKHRIEYLVLERTPAPGLPKRSSTDLRGF
jgi:cytidyltransferase-like protein